MDSVYDGGHGPTLGPEGRYRSLDDLDIESLLHSNDSNIAFKTRNLEDRGSDDALSALGDEKGITLEELLAQGIENPFGLADFSTLPEQGISQRAVQSITSSLPSVPKSRDLSHPVESGYSIEALIPSQESNTFADGGAPEPVLKIKRLEESFDIDDSVSEIVNEVLREEDKSYLFEDDPKEKSEKLWPWSKQGQKCQAPLLQEEGKEIKEPETDIWDEELNLAMAFESPPSQYGCQALKIIEEGARNIMRSRGTSIGKSDHFFPPQTSEQQDQISTKEDSSSSTTPSYVQKQSFDSHDMFKYPIMKPAKIELPKVIIEKTNVSQIIEDNIHQEKDAVHTSKRGRTSSNFHEMRTPEIIEENSYQNMNIKDSFPSNRTKEMEQRIKETIYQVSKGIKPYKRSEQPSKTMASGIDSRLENSRENSVGQQMPQCEETSLAGSNEHIYLNASQIYVTHLFPTATLHPEQNGEVKIVFSRMQKKEVTSFSHSSPVLGDEMIECIECGKWSKMPCSLHTLALVLDNSVIRNGTLKERALFTTPWPFKLKQSKVRGAGVGVWTDAHVPKGLVFGPYEGRIITTMAQEGHSGYSWMISRQGWEPFFVDAADPSFSNWLRYVNCGRSEAENNLEAFQFLGQIYYRTVRDIQRGTELMVWYGDEFGKMLGISLNKRLRPDVSPCESCSARFRDQKDLFFHRCSKPSLSTPSNSLPCPPVKRKRGRKPKKLLGIDEAKITRLISEPIPKLAFMAVSQNKGKENVTRNTAYAPPETPFSSAEVDKSSKIMIQNCNFKPQESSTTLHPVNVPPKRGRGRPRLSAKAPKSRNKAFKTLVSRGRPSRGRRNGAFWENFEVHDCLKCHKSFSSKEILANHNKEVHERKMVITNFKKPSKRIQITRGSQARGSTSANAYRCLTCSLSFKSHMECLEHDLNHFQNSPLQCGCCQSRFNTFSDLTEHMEKLVRRSNLVCVTRASSSNADCNTQIDLKLLLNCKSCKALMKHTKNITVIFKTHMIELHKSAYTDILKDFNSFAYTHNYTTEEETFRVNEGISCCPLCFERPVDTKDLDRHIDEHNNSVLRKCTHCHVWFPSKTSLFEHATCHESCLKILETHPDRKEAVDFINKLPATLLSKLQTQVYNQNRSSVVSCYNLNNSSDNAEKGTHPKANSPPPPPLIENEREESFQDEKKSFVRSNDADSSSPTPVRRMRRKRKCHPCPICEMQLFGLQALKEHKKTHKKQITCPICQASFDTHAALRRHKASHQPPPPCNVCNRIFPNSALLKQHKKIHRKLVMFECSTCQQKFRSKSSYLFHLSKHASPQQTFKCNYCGASICPDSGLKQPHEANCPFQTPSNEPQRRSVFIKISVRDAASVELPSKTQGDLSE